MKPLIIVSILIFTLVLGTGYFIWTNKDISPSSASSTNAGPIIGGTEMDSTGTIAENIQYADNLITFVSFLNETNHFDTLNGTGPYTVFIPRDEAFRKLPAGTVDGWLLPDNNAELRSIVSFHIVPGRYTTKELINGKTLTTYDGDTIRLSEQNGKLYIGNAAIVIQDITVSNGVIHVIDSILIP